MRSTEANCIAGAYAIIDEVLKQREERLKQAMEKETKRRRGY